MDPCRSPGAAGHHEAEDTTDKAHGEHELQRRGPSAASASKPGGGRGAAGTSSRLMTPGALDNVRLGLAVGSEDPAVVRTAQGLALPSILPTLPSVPSQSMSSFLQTPQPPPPLSMPALLAPNIASEAEQISKVVTGQPIATAVTGPNQQGLAAFAPASHQPAPTDHREPGPGHGHRAPGNDSHEKAHIRRPQGVQSIGQSHQLGRAIAMTCGGR